MVLSTICKTIFKQITSSFMVPQVKQPIIAIIGTTGVGKSKFSIELAKKYNGEIINADSMQMYKGCPIITNKHPVDERENIPHYVMDHVDWDEEYFIHRFQKEALGKIQEIHDKGKVPIVVGGTNYYLQSLLFNNRVMDNERKGDDTKGYLTKQEVIDTLSEEQRKILNSGDKMIVYNTLREIDPVIANKFHPNDFRRVKRVLEIYYQTNEKPSDIYERQQQADKRGSNDTNNLRYNTLIYWLWSKQDALNERLDARVDDMIHQGALEEIKELYDLYMTLMSKNKNLCQHGIWQVIGFKEFLPWLEHKQKESADFEIAFDPKDNLLMESIEKMKQKTRKYSKLQIKWIKNILIKDLEKNSTGDKINSLYLLNATDLSQWNDNVQKDGFKVFENFLEQKNSSLYIPDDVKSILYTVNPKLEKMKRSNSALDTDGAFDDQSELRWKQYRCDVCKNKDKDKDYPVILIGEDQWNIHLASRRHRSNLKRIK